MAILGASNKPERFAFRAWRALREHGHDVQLVSPNVDTVEGHACVASVNLLRGPIDTLTMYVGPAVSTGLIDAIVALRPGRVIFNPGAENPALVARLGDAGIPHENACTLVLLESNRF